MFSSPNIDQSTVNLIKYKHYCSRGVSAKAAPANAVTPAHPTCNTREDPPLKTGRRLREASRQRGALSLWLKCNTIAYHHHLPNQNTSSEVREAATFRRSLSHPGPTNSPLDVRYMSLIKLAEGYNQLSWPMSWLFTPTAEARTISKGLIDLWSSLWSYRFEYLALPRSLLTAHRI